jgi:thiamine-phosphate pyrophosphorylase
MKMDENERRALKRILDANANRCAEGLRVIEELARFVLEDEALQREMKRIRHEVRDAARGFGINLVGSRDSMTDVGRRTTSKTEGERDSLDGVANANFSRVQEALRVLEEYGKLIDTEVSLRFKALRFDIYNAQKDLGFGEPRAARIPASPFVYAILDRSSIGADSLLEAFRSLMEGGVGMIQYRAKGVRSDLVKPELQRIVDVAGTSGVPVIVNDDPSLALEAGAHGVHLGRNDPRPDRARALLGPEAIIGASVHSLAELDDLSLEAVDYIAVGSVFQSTTKPEVPVCGLDLLRVVRKRVSRLPIIAIGGIDAENADSVFDAGADGIALVKALLKGDILKNCFTFQQIIDRRSD